MHFYVSFKFFVSADYIPPSETVFCNYTWEHLSMDQPQYKISVRQAINWLQRIVKVLYDQKIMYPLEKYWRRTSSSQLCALRSCCNTKVSSLSRPLPVLEIKLCGPKCTAAYTLKSLRMAVKGLMLYQWYHQQCEKEVMLDFELPYLFSSFLMTFLRMTTNYK